MAQIRKKYQHKKDHPYLKKMYRMLKYYFLLMVRKEDPPERIAHGLAMGIFIGFLPIIPLQTVTILVLCTFFKTNKLAGIIGTNIFTNPFNALATFYGVHFLGRIFILHDFTYAAFKNLFTQISVHNIAVFGKDLLTLFYMVTIGGVIMGIITYPIIYFLTYKYIVKKRKKIKHQRKLKFLQKNEQTV